MSDLDSLIAEAELGEEAKNFLGSALGKKILELADKEAENALLALGEVDPSKTEEIRRLQMDLKFGRSFAAWLVGIVSAGDQAISVWKQQQDTQ